MPITGRNNWKLYIIQNIITANDVSFISHKNVYLLFYYKGEN